MKLYCDNETAVSIAHAVQYDMYIAKHVEIDKTFYKRKARGRYLYAICSNNTIDG